MFKRVKDGDKITSSGHNKILTALEIALALGVINSISILYLIFK